MEEQKTIDVTEEIVTEVATEIVPTEEAAPQQNAQVVCTGCGAEVPKGVKFCPSCGVKVEIQVAGPTPCKGCGTEIPEGMKFCPNCGKPSNLAAKKSAQNKLLKKPILIGAAATVVLAVIVTLVILLAPPKEILAADIVLSDTKIELKEEEILTVSCTVYPQDATDKIVVWTSSDEEIATVNEVGTITAVGKGECTITAKCGDAVKEISVKVNTKIDFKALYEALDEDIKYGWSVGSDGSYLSADTNVYNLDDYGSESIWASIKEMNKTLSLPASLTEDMNQTTWSMGRQTQKFTSVGVEVTWTFHPDKGMEVTYKLIVD